MYNLKSYLQDLSSSTGIGFNLVSEENTEVLYNGLNVEGLNVERYSLNLGKSKAYIELQKSFESCILLLKYTIETKYNELFSMREQVIIELLEDKEVGIDKISKNLSFLEKGATLFLINVDGSRYEAVNIIKQLYDTQEVVAIIYGDNIVVLGEFDDINEHAKSMRLAVMETLYCKCYVSFSDIQKGSYAIKNAYDHSKECMMLGKKFDIKQDVFDYNKMLFEKIVYNINEEIKKQLLGSFAEKFNLFDNEILITIEEFVSCGLNVSDAARKLYIHRNTLIYRLDKIQKETGFDIRNFKEATVFIIAFLVWKESK